MASYASGFPQAGADDPMSQETSPETEEDLRKGDDADDEDDKKDELLLEGLTPDLEKKLIDLVLEFERESYPVWRFLNRDFFEAESFWKDLQLGYYDAKNDVWRVPTTETLSKIGETGQRFTFQTNIYRALGSAIVSTLGQKMPTTRFLASDFTRESDVLAANSAASVTPLIERNNKIQLLNARAAYLLYTHGIIVAYVRYLEDAERFGWKEEPEIAYEKVVAREAGYECMYCGANNIPASSQFQMGGSSSLTGEEHDQAAPPVSGLTCPNCSRPLSEINFRPAEYDQVPVETGTKLVPRGQEVISLHGGLESRMPPWAQNMQDWPYYGLVHEVHIASLRGTYGNRAKNLQGGWGSGPYDTWDRFARLALVEPTVSYYGTSNQNLVTFKRYWLRPSTFYMMAKDEDRDALLEIFPDGAYIAFADSTKLLDARNERMDDHIRVCQAVEGAGAYTPAMGSSVISIQKRFNTVMNYIMEWIEYAAAGPGTFFNANVINYKAMKNHRRAPGTFYPLRMAINQPISNVMREGQPGQISGEVFKHGDDLRTLGEFVSGAVPTVTGGTEQSLKPTTYISDKESALGRLYTAWLHLRLFWADVMLLAVKEFSRWRTKDEVYTLIGPDGEAKGMSIRLEDLQGNFDAYPETNEQFHVLWQQMQQTFMQLIQIAPNDPFVGEILSDLDNVPFAKAMLGLPDLYVPGMDDRMKQKHEIALLLQQKPTQVPSQNPQTGAIGVKLMPSIPIAWEDNDPVHELTVKKWAVSAEGLKAQLENNAGYKNVIAHGQMHEEHRMMMMAQQAAQESQQKGGGKDGSKNGSKSESGVRSGRGAAGGGSKKSSNEASDNSAEAGGASPVQQTEGIKSDIEASTSGGIPSP
jgi:hypothetical protein